MSPIRLLIVLSLLVSAAPFARADVIEERYAKFYQSEIAGKLESEKTSENRVVILRGFEIHDCKSAVDYLIGLMQRDKAADVKRECIRMLLKYKRKDSVDAMIEAWSKIKKPAEMRAVALEMFQGRKHPQVEKLLATAMKDRHGMVAQAACRVAGDGEHYGLRKNLITALKHKEPAVRSRAAYALGEFGGDEGMAEVFWAFCTDKSDRVRFDAWRALRKMSRENHPCDPNAWREFHKTMAAADATSWKGFPRLYAKAGKPANFFGVPVLGDRVIFVLDLSGSMLEPWLIDHKAEKAKKREERIPNFFSVKTRWDLLKAYMKRTLGQMPEHTQVGIVTYQSKVARFPATGKMMKNSKRGRTAMLTFLEESKVSASTMMYEGLVSSWTFLKGGAPKNFAKGADTIIFLTDGQSRAGEMKNREERLQDEAWFVSRTRGINVHTVGLHNHAFAVCQALAEDAGGLYVHFQQAGDTSEPQDLEFWPEKKKAFEAARKKKKRGR